jgi:hypothetical protein
MFEHSVDEAKTKRFEGFTWDARVHFFNTANSHGGGQSIE